MIAVIIATLVGTARADDGPRARVQYNALDAKTYSGSVTNVGAGYRGFEKFDLGLNADLLDRSYRGGATVRDTQWTGSASRALTERAYVDVTGGFATTAAIYARGFGSIAPHYVYEATDFGLGLRYATYRLTDVGVLNPSVLHYFANGLTLGVGANVVRTDENIASGTLTAIYDFGRGHVVRAGGGLGRTLEDAGLTAHFQSLSFEYAYTYSARWTAAVGYVDYRSQVRQEQTIAVRLGWR